MCVCVSVLLECVSMRVFEFIKKCYVVGEALASLRALVEPDAGLYSLLFPL